MPLPTASPLPPAPALGALLVGLMLAAAAPAPAAPLPPEARDMQRFCQGEAASAFRVSPRAIRTLPVERRLGSGYVVYGQTPADGESALFFVCSFDNGRRFTGVRTTADQRASGAGRSEPMPVSEMPRFCRGMVAEEFRLNPRAISVLDAEKQPNGSYTVQAIARPTSANTTEVFECRFGSKGRYKRVERPRN
ncbi:hypothetical protein [Cyanobium sp. NIES-981]|uniref:hypothetical protein n=1 Tax=Cyanobium sp. NIES-981 TaxID=1851505 RepID=UPI0007DDDFAD|nr:hypothetical protein [Cyanobium sp. NIES-981]SBO43950.1 conserved exported protein of unknown function [Cyanobium sp. NIES-981]